MNSLQGHPGQQTVRRVTAIRAVFKIQVMLSLFTVVKDTSRNNNVEDIKNKSIQLK